MLRNKITNIIFNVFISVLTIVVIWGAGSSIMDSIIRYGIVKTILSLIIGIPVFMGAMVLSKFVDKKKEVR